MVPLRAVLVFVFAMPRNRQRDTVRANDKTKLRDINGRISVASATYHWEDPRNRRTDDININHSMCGVYDGFEYRLLCIFRLTRVAAAALTRRVLSLAAHNTQGGVSVATPGGTHPESKRHDETT